MSHRTAMLAKIHVAKKDLALTDDTYRALLARMTKHESAARCSDEQLDKVLGEFQRLGWRPKARKAPKRAGKRPLATGDQARKVRALWLSLYHLGVVRSPEEAAIAAYARRVAKVDALQWMSPEQGNLVIEGLKDWCERSGFDQPSKQHVELISARRAAAQLEPADWGLAAKSLLIVAQWRILIAAGVFRTGDEARLETWLRREAGVSAPWFLDHDAADRCVEQLGAWIRRVKPAEGSQ